MKCISSPNSHPSSLSLSCFSTASLSSSEQRSAGREGKVCSAALGIVGRDEKWKGVRKRGSLGEGRASLGRGMDESSPPCARACVLRAEGDGVDPVLVLQMERGPWCNLRHGTAVGPPQYIFGAPEGLSRFLLTHRRILGENGPPLPSPSLKAIFTSALDPSQVGGLVGLFLRLKADGHEKVRHPDSLAALSPSC